ncbi:hypothetical protein AEAC466_19840 [Asticcacaulis sp. AC466]|uniref:hypothetical protein n=1 Tax=Asticcacaulis sp. AC466 TaxID=1282362 RepID=UPI0003C40D9B|nr:hypothetical protein [Asticcacaulis sp. AC466]ESQ81817.1 hypothetical protein AEAC466_19840 [Asticcacaulis sp. AC466]
MTEQTGPATPPLYKRSPAWRRVAAAFALALCLALAAYAILSLVRSESGFASVSFLAVLPAILSALICYIGDPAHARGAGFYWTVPAVLVALICAAAAWPLHEGIVCLIMLAPIWLLSGWAGAFLLRRLRKRVIDPTLFQSSLAVFPLLALLVEGQLPYPPQDFTVTRRIVIEADAATVWPFAVSNAHIAPSEGKWTFSQNIVGLPRPRATVLRGTGVGAVRTAYWGDHIHFDEIITGWEPGHRLAWRFSFPDDSLRTYTDKHISPDGPALKIASGDYTLKALSPGRTLLTLRTRYVARTHVNLYAAAWGEVFLGDIQSNVLTLIRDRAEHAAHARRGEAGL